MYYDCFSELSSSSLIERLVRPTLAKVSLTVLLERKTEEGSRFEKCPRHPERNLIYLPAISILARLNALSL